MDTKIKNNDSDVKQPGAVSALSASTDSVQLDGSKEFEIIVNDRDFIRITAKELKSIRSDYDEFKAEALRKGYKVIEHSDPRDGSHLARFTSPNVEDNHAN